MVANMIGTGAFTTLGVQLRWLNNGPALLLMWALGGLVAWCGAVSYAELGVRMPKSGGEAHFLSQLFHPILGFLSGWVSLTVGFAAAVALSAMGVGSYLGDWLGTSPVVIAAARIVVLSGAHCLGTRQSSWLQNGLTILKVSVVLLLGLAGALLPTGADGGQIDWSFNGISAAWSPGAAVALMAVFYAFSGWNAAAYIVGEIRQPARNLPRALVGGTLLVTALFLLLQYGFLRQAGPAALAGKIDVATIATAATFGPAAGQWIGLLVGGLLLTGISAMIWIGPRVVVAMGEGHEIWRLFGRTSRRGVPVRATWLQGGISLFLVFTASFERILLYSGFVLQCFTFLAVAGLLLLRWREGAAPAGYRSPWFPVPQFVFLLFSAWSMGYLLVHQPVESLLGLLNVIAGLAAYYLDLAPRAKEA